MIHATIERLGLPFDEVAIGISYITYKFVFIWNIGGKMELIWLRQEKLLTARL